MLIVTGLIITLATIPIAYIRRARDKTFEAEAVRALQMMSLAYENYYSQYGHHYPNFRSDSVLMKNVEFVDPEQLWDSLIAYSLLPRRFSGRPHNENNLLARGYYFSIYPIDYGTLPILGVGESYAIGMFPYPGSLAKRDLVVIKGQRFFSLFPTATVRKTKGAALSDTTIYSLQD